MEAFRRAVEAWDIHAAVALLADDVEFRSPVVHAPYRGPGPVGVVLQAVARVFEDFRYVRVMASADGRDHALVFRARVGDRELEGCDFLHLDDEGRVDELVVMVRPRSGLEALAAAMRLELDR